MKDELHPTGRIQVGGKRGLNKVPLVRLNTLFNLTHGVGCIDLSYVDYSGQRTLAANSMVSPLWRRAPDVGATRLELGHFLWHPDLVRKSLPEIRFAA